MLIRCLRLFIPLITVFVLVGCFDYSETLNLAADGSGTLEQNMVFYKEYLGGLMDMMQAFSDDSTADTAGMSMMQRADVEKALAKYKGKIKLLDFKETSTDSTVDYRIKYAFTDLTAMMAAAREVGKEDPSMSEDSPFATDEEPERKAEKVEFVRTNGGWKFSREFGDSSMGDLMGAGAPDSTPEDSATGMDGMAKMMENMMLKMFADRKVKLTVKFPGQVTAANATLISGNQATWEYKLMDISKAPRFMEATIKP